MKNRYHIYKNISFPLLIITGFSYLSLLLILTVKVVPSFIMQVILFLDILKNKHELSIFLKSLDTYTSLIAFIILSYLLVKLVRGLKHSIKGHFVLKKFLKNLVILEETFEYILIDSKEDLAFSSGLFKHKIYISNSFKEKLNSIEFRAVLEHELHHSKSKDSLRKYILKYFSNIIPDIPGKKSIFESYNVLTELCADLSSELKIKDKKHLISALWKIDTSPIIDNLNFSAFSLKNDRIKILTGKETFKVKSFFSLIFFITAFVFVNTLVIKNTDILIQCQHILECFQTLFTKEGEIEIKERKYCMYSSNSSSSGCINRIESHTPIMIQSSSISHI